MEHLEEKLSYKFRNPELIHQALTYTPFQAETNSPLNSRKRTCDHLKILGDCVIKLMTSQYALCASLPNEHVSKVVVKKDSICNRSCQIKIGKTLKLKENGLIITNLPPEQIPSHDDIFLKSIFGAVFLDAGGSQKKGFVTCWKLFSRLWQPILSASDRLIEVTPLIACFPKPKWSSQEFLKERHNSYKIRDLALLEEKIKHKFLKHPHLLEQAMTHDSIDLHKTPGETPDPSCPEFTHFQNLEFLGDSVIELVIMEYLYLRSSSADPLGQMLFCTRDTGEKLYSSRFQIQVAKRLCLENFVIKPPHVGLACYDDFVESLIGAVYVQGKVMGLRNCSKVVLEIWGLESSEEEDETMESPIVANGVPVQTPKKEIKTISASISTPVQTVKKSGKENVVSTPMQTPKKPGKDAKTPSSPLAQAVKKEAVIPLPMSSPKNKSIIPAACQGNTVDPLISDVHKDLQMHFQYTFTNDTFLKYLPVKIDVSTDEAKQKTVKLISTAKNIQVVGKCALDLVITEYVIGISHSSETTDLSAKMKASATTLIKSLCTDEVLSDVTKRYQLTKHFRFSNNAGLPNPQETPQQVVYLLFGCVFLDTSASIETIRKIFSRLWKSYMGSVVSKEIVNCFPDTSPEQTKFRAGLRATITPTMWKKLFTLLGYTSTRKNLLEQALTDEKSQAYGKQVLNAYPLGNQFALILLGKSVTGLFVAQRTYLNCLEEPGNFAAVQLRMDNSLTNSLKTRFMCLEKGYYAKIFKDPYPPKRNPKAPFEAMFGAMYVDAGAGVKGYRQVQGCVVKCCPAILTINKGKGVGVEANQGSSSEVVEACDRSDEVKSSTSTSTKEVKVPERMTSHTMEPDVDPFVELQFKLSYSFGNPQLLRIVLEGISTENSYYFELLKTVGGRAVDLLATEFALESLPITPNEDFNDHGKMLVRERIRVVRSGMDLIFDALELKRFLGGKQQPVASNENVIMAIIGAVLVDSNADFARLSTVFSKVWNIDFPGKRPTPLHVHFPVTTAGQTFFRTAMGKTINAAQWKKLSEKLCYNFFNRNLAEQALMDENSQLKACLRFKACPTGNPFALKLLGKCVIQLIISYTSLPASLSAPVPSSISCYLTTLQSLEKGLYNSFQNNFMGMHSMYATVSMTNKKVVPQCVFDGLLGAVYADSGFGKTGFNAVTSVIISRKIGIKPSHTNVFKTLGASNLSTIETTVNPAIDSRPTTPVPSGSSGSGSLNTSFNSKCAANFGISPVQLKASPQVLVKTCIPNSSVREWASSASEQSASPVPTSSNGTQIQTDNKLILAISNAQSAIQSLRRQQERTDAARVLLLENKSSSQTDQDQASCSSRSRNASSSTITSVGSKKPKDSKKKRKRGAKKAKAVKQLAAPPAPIVKSLPSPKKEVQESRISTWCQNQLDSISGHTPTPVDASCTLELGQQRPATSEPKVETECANVEEDMVPTHVGPVDLSCTGMDQPMPQDSSKMDGGATRKSDDDGYTTGSSNGNASRVPIQVREPATPSLPQQESTITVMQIAKWASVVVVGALLLRKYSR